MTSITERNAAALKSRNGSTLPETKPKRAVAKGNDQAATPQAAPAPVAGVACPCGCGETAAPGRVYRPGHDARHAGQVGRLLVSDPEAAAPILASLQPALQKKARAYADRQARLAAEKAARAEIRAKAKAELAAALAAL